MTTWCGAIPGSVTRTRDARNPQIFGQIRRRIRESTTDIKKLSHHHSRSRERGFPERCSSFPGWCDWIWRVSAAVEKQRPSPIKKAGRIDQLRLGIVRSSALQNPNTSFCPLNTHTHLSAKDSRLCSACWEEGGKSKAPNVNKFLPSPQPSLCLRLVASFLPSPCVECVEFSRICQDSPSSVPACFPSSLVDS